MSLESLLYLLAWYWPYLGAAALVGLVTGWQNGGPGPTPR